MKLIDLSREIYHRMPRLLNHPSIIITPFATHDEVREADGYRFSSATMSLAMGDHAGTHVDAPYHFDARPGALTIDQVPLENYLIKATWRRSVTLGSTAFPEQRVLVRETSVSSGSAKASSWTKRKALVSVTAYHAFDGEVEALTIRRVTPSCLHQLSRTAQLKIALSKSVVIMSSYCTTQTKLPTLDGSKRAR